jgi:FkbM family methyltransferase
MEIEQRIEEFYNSNKKKSEKQILPFKAYLENKDIIDIGSNIGLISLAICNNLKYKSIHLFEPNPHYLNYSKKILNKYNNIFFNNVGVGNINEERILYSSKNENIGWNTFLEKDPLQNNNFIKNMDQYLCKIIKLDDYYQYINNIDFIKIYVEGYEALAIEGAFELIKKFKPYIYVEVGWGTNHPTWENNILIYNKLFDIGYKKVEFTNKTEDILFEPIN